MNRILFTAAFILTVMACTITTAIAQVSKVGQQTLSLNDESRGRKLTTEIWYPTKDPAPTTALPYLPFVRMQTVMKGALPEGKFPLILFSHGTGASRLSVEWFCAGLAANGYIVAAVDHFGNTYDNKIPEMFVKFWERPLDLKFILNEILKTPELAKIIDTDRIGAAGFSIGGFTAIALTGAKPDIKSLQTYMNTPQGEREADIPEMPGLISLIRSTNFSEDFYKAPPLSDPRIKSVFAMSPAIGQAFPSKENFRDVKAPLYIVIAEKDQITPAKTNASHYAALYPGARITIFEGDAHALHFPERSQGRSAGRGTDAVQGCTWR